MSDPPPSPQVSPDGRYYWDGQRWAPMTGLSAAQQPTPYSTQPQPHQQLSPYTAQSQPMMLYRPSTNGLATASLVFGIISWFLCPLIGGIIAVACGHIAHSQIKRTGESGSGLATAGLVLGYIHLAAFAVGIVISILVFGSLAALLALIGAAVIGTAAPSPSP